MSKVRKSKKQRRLKSLKAKLTGGQSNIPDNTSLEKYLASVGVADIPLKHVDSIIEAIFAKKRIPKDYVGTFSKKYKLKGLVKGKFEAKLRAVEFLLGQSEFDLNETTDSAISNLTDLLISTFKKGMQTGKKK